MMIVDPQAVCTIFLLCNVGQSDQMFFGLMLGKVPLSNHQFNILETFCTQLMRRTWVSLFSYHIVSYIGLKVSVCRSWQLVDTLKAAIQCLRNASESVTSCQIRNIFARHFSKVKRRFGYIDKYLNFAYFEMIRQLKHIL